MYFDGVIYKLRSWTKDNRTSTKVAVIRPYLRLSGVSDEECEDNDKVSM